MSARLYAQEFANYVLAKDPPNLLLRSEAYCAQAHLYKEFKPSWYRLLPYGYVLLYPEWVAFFTDSKQAPGRIPDSIFSAKEFLSAYAQAWKYGARLQTIGSFVRIAREASKTERDRTIEFMRNPNSLFIPLNTVISFEQIWSFSNGGTLCVRTNDGRDIHFTPNAGLALPGRRSFQATKAQFGLKWEPILQDALQKAIELNQR
jgi:hypothetical protein